MRLAFSNNQAKTILNVRLNKMLSSSYKHEVENNSRVASKIIKQISCSKARFLTGNRDLLLAAIGLVCIRTIGNGMVEIISEFNGTEECDGEDAGIIKFYLNANSSTLQELKQSIILNAAKVDETGMLKALS
jgi:hypothetical protein